MSQSSMWKQIHIISWQDGFGSKYSLNPSIWGHFCHMSRHQDLMQSVQMELGASD